MGRWYGESLTKDNLTQKWLIERRLDGGFTVQFKQLKGKKTVYTQTEFGLWGVSGNVYFTISREALYEGRVIPLEVETSNPYDAYEILYLDAFTVRYRSLDSGDIFESKKVTADYKLD
jgi:hypothetical protein